MARFMDFHQDLKLPAEPIAQMAEDARNARTTSSACARSSCTTTPRARCTACWKDQTNKPCAGTAPHGEGPCGDIHRVDSLT